MPALHRALSGVLDELMALQTENQQQRSEMEQIKLAKEEIRKILQVKTEESTKVTKAHAVEMSNAVEDLHNMKMDADKVCMKVSKSCSGMSCHISIRSSVLSTVAYSKIWVVCSATRQGCRDCRTK